METTTRAELREFTLRAILCGVLFGCLFGAANAYLGLKAGLTVSTSIPIAVLSAAVFKLLPRGGTLLEANMAQTIGSASSSLASGTIFTIPALFLWGFAPPVHQVALLAFFGGLLGILAMIPLRRLLIVQADAELPYPEGRACAEVLRATQESSSGGRWIFIGIALGAAIKLVTGALHLLPEDVATSLAAMPNAQLAIKVAPALLAVGYIVGFKASAVMVSGALITSLVLYPLITKVHTAAGGAGLTPKAIKDQFTIFVGAGAVTCAGLFTVIKTAPTMVQSLAAVVRGFGGGAANESRERTDRDLPSWVIVVGLVTLVIVLSTVPWLFAGDLGLGARTVAALGVALFGFLFVPVSSRLVGLIGVSSNPVSAMALITIASTAAIFLALGWTGTAGMGAVLTVGTVVCVAASKAGDISQDLKTGWLVKGTPALQQAGQLIAASVACWVIALVVIALGESSNGFSDGTIAAPQANLMKTVVEAVLGGSLPWDLLLSGVALGGVGILAGLPALPFALGIYLPLSTMASVFVGGIVRRIVDGPEAGKGKESGASAGILCASGLVAGEGLAGVLVAGFEYYRKASGAVAASHEAPTGFDLALSLGLLVFASFVLVRAGRVKV
jgi:putative OPT family oligopeptide transporter